MKAYVACSLRAVLSAGLWAAALKIRGVDVVSTWHDVARTTTSDPLDELVRQGIIRTITAEIARANCLLVLAHLAEPRATFVEAGIAIGLGKPIAWVHDGSIGRQIFDSHPRTVRFDVGAPPPDLPAGYNVFDAAFMALNQAVAL